jgi:hypothetical protein
MMYNLSPHRKTNPGTILDRVADNPNRVWNPVRVRLAETVFNRKAGLPVAVK